MRIALCAAAALLFSAASGAAQARRPQVGAMDTTWSGRREAPEDTRSSVAASPRQVEPGVHDPWLAPDKMQHFSASFALTAFTHATVASVTSSHNALSVAIPTAALAGIAKEVYDRRSGGFFSSRDLVADAAGVLLAWLILREVR